MGEQDITTDDIEYALYQIKEAEERLARVKRRAYISDEDADLEDITIEDLNQFVMQNSAANMILDLQLCIELSVKSMFIATGVEHPQKHDIEFDDNRTEGLLRNIPDDFDKGEKVPRAVFLTQFWHQFYELTKYGVPDLGLKPVDITALNDVKKAISDGEFCVEIAKDLVEYQAEGFDVSSPMYWGLD